MMQASRLEIECLLLCARIEARRQGLRRALNGGQGCDKASMMDATSPMEQPMKFREGTSKDGAAEISMAMRGL